MIVTDNLNKRALICVGDGEEFANIEVRFNDGTSARLLVKKTVWRGVFSIEARLESGETVAFRANDENYHALPLSILENVAACATKE